MTHDDQPPQAILDLVDSVRELEQRAALQYQPVVDDILRTGSRDARHIEPRWTVCWTSVGTSRWR